MLASIHPLGERARRNRWWLTASAHILGSAAGGALSGSIAGAAGRVLLGGSWVSPELRIGLLVTICTAGALVEARGRRPPWPVRRQVDDGWLPRYRGWVYGAGFGLQLGAGLATIVTTAAVPAALALALVTASWGSGVLVGLTFGLSRGLPLLLTARIDTPTRLWTFQRRFQAAGGAARWMTVAVLAIVAAVGGLLLALAP